MVLVAVWASVEAGHLLVARRQKGHHEAHQLLRLGPMRVPALGLMPTHLASCERSVCVKHKKIVNTYQ